jgi:hypothetical protein
VTRTERNLLFGFAGREDATRRIKWRYHVAIKRLRERGLVEAELDIEPDALRGRHRTIWQLKLTPTGKDFIRDAGTD